MSTSSTRPNMLNSSNKTNISHVKNSISGSFSVNNLQSHLMAPRSDANDSPTSTYLIDAFQNMSLAYGDLFSSQQQQHSTQSAPQSSSTTATKDLTFDDITNIRVLLDDFVPLEQTDALTASFDWLKSIIDDPNNISSNQLSVARDDRLFAEDDENGAWLSNECSSLN